MKMFVKTSFICCSSNELHATWYTFTLHTNQFPFMIRVTSRYEKLKMFVKTSSICSSSNELHATWYTFKLAHKSIALYD